MFFVFIKKVLWYDINEKVVLSIFWMFCVYFLGLNIFDPRSLKILFFVPYGSFCIVDSTLFMIKNEYGT